MKRTMLFLLFAALVVVVAGGCANPYLSPQTSAAIHDREVLRELEEQTKIMEKQTEIMQEQTKLLREIAERS